MVWALRVTLVASRVVGECFVRDLDVYSLTRRKP